MLRYRGNKEELQNYMREHAAYFSDLDMEIYRAVSVFLRSERLLKKIEKEYADGKEMRLDMCKALEDLYEDGVEKGKEAGKRDFARNLEKMGMTVEKIAEAAGESVSVVRQWLNQDRETKGQYEGDKE